MSVLNCLSIKLLWLVVCMMFRHYVKQIRHITFRTLYYVIMVIVVYTERTCTYILVITYLVEEFWPQLNKTFGQVET